MAKLCKITYVREGGQECVMPTQEYIKQVIEDMGAMRFYAWAVGYRG